MSYASFAEAELAPRGFKLVRENEKEVVLQFGHLKFLFECDCPAYPTTKGLGCPIHCNYTGGSWPVEKARGVAIFLDGMSKAKVSEVIGVYRQKFVGMGIKKIKHSHNEPLSGFFRTMRMRALAHCHQMLDTMDSFVDEDRMGKAYRWLGFVQGVLWALGVYRLEDLMNHSRPTE